MNYVAHSMGKDLKYNCMKKYRNVLDVYLSRIKIGFLVAFAATFLLSSCLEKEELDLSNGIDAESFDLPVNLAMPIAKGKVLLKDAIKEFNSSDFDGEDVSLLTYGPEKGIDSGLLYLDYKDVFPEHIIDIDLVIPDQIEIARIDTSEFGFSIPDELGIPLSFLPGMSFEHTDTVFYDMSFEGGELDRALLKSGLFKVYANNIFEGNADMNQSLDVTILELTSEGRIFEKKFENFTNDIDTAFDIADNTLVISSDNIDNRFVRLVYTYKIKNEGSSFVPVPLSDSLYFEYSISNIYPKYVKGYFGTRKLFSEKNTIEVNDLNTEEFKDLDIFFKDPQLEVNLSNPIGMPFDVILNQFSIINKKENDTIKFLLKEIDDNTFHIGGGTPVYGLTNVDITPFDYSYVFDRTTSNIDELFLKPFDEVYIDYDVISNPDEYTLDNVLRLDSTEIYYDVHVVLPLWLRIRELTVEDTMDFDFYTEVLKDDELDTATIDNLDSLVVYLDIINDLPLELSASVFMVDADYSILDSIKLNDENILLPGSMVESDGSKGEPKETSLKLVFSPDMRDKWRDTKYIIFKAKTSTSKESEDISVKFYDYLGIDFSIGFEASGRVSNSLIDSEDNNEN